ncbi:glycosyltransferase family 2 protein [Methylobacterium mesophilicum]|uniref:glycosyltransferase family 2 protein n=1 Tax=Methylobacterium mesophilicum TaxID=39956 RepID=UPI002F2C858B
MNVLILAAGDAPSEPGTQTYPTWLSEVDGTLLLERQVRLLEVLKPTKFAFLFRQEHVETYYLDNIVEQIAPGSAVLSIRGQTAGAACTALLAMGEIEMDGELIVASATDQIDVEISGVIDGFRRRGADAGVLTFPSLHPRYSYVRVNPEGWVVESSEKRPISRSASAGLYWFRRASEFFSGAKEMIIKDAHVQGRFYICPVLNELVLAHKRIAVFPLTAEQYHPLKSDKMVDHFEHRIDDGVTG